MQQLTRPMATTTAPPPRTDVQSAAAPFFVLGSQRSGTTMLRLMINRHSRLAVPHETGFITPFYRKLAAYNDCAEASDVTRLLRDVAKHKLVVRGGLIPDQDAVLARAPGDYRAFVEAVMGVYCARHGKARWGDKTPFYTEDVDVLRQIFPNAKIVHLVRDGRDVVASQKAIEWMSKNVPKLARDWAWKVTLLRKVGACLGGDYLEVRYEDLVRAPEAALREICSFLGEPYEPEMLGYSESAEGVVPAESLRWHRNSVRPPDPAKLGEWRTKLSLGEQAIVDELAGPALELFGYPRAQVSASWRTRATKLYYACLARY